MLKLLNLIKIGLSSDCFPFFHDFCSDIYVLSQKYTFSFLRPFRLLICLNCDFVETYSGRKNSVAILLRFGPYLP